MSACACVWLGAFSFIFSLCHFILLAFLFTSIQLSACSGARTWDSRLFIIVFLLLLWVQWTWASKADRAHVNVKNGKEPKKAQQNEQSQWEMEMKREPRERSEVSSMDFMCVWRLWDFDTSVERKVVREKKFRKPAQNRHDTTHFYSRRKTWSHKSRKTHNPKQRQQQQHFNGTKSLYCVHPDVFYMLNNKPLNYIKCSCSHFVRPIRYIYVFLCCYLQWWLRSESHRLCWQIPLENWRNFNAYTQILLATWRWRYKNPKRYLYWIAMLKSCARTKICMMLSLSFLFNGIHKHSVTHIHIGMRTIQGNRKH